MICPLQRLILLGSRGFLPTRRQPHDDLVDELGNYAERVGREHPLAALLGSALSGYVFFAGSASAHAATALGGPNIPCDGSPFGC